MKGILLAALLSGCNSDLTHISGTTTRIGTPVADEDSELELKIFTTEAECRATVKTQDLALCMPHVDRAHGEVRLGFQLRLDSDDFPVPLSKENIVLTHQGTRIQEGLEGQRYTLIPHDPTRAPQLFILVIDGSSSMSETDGGRVTRMDKVRDALVLPEVQEAFFPDGVKTGVVVLEFTDGQPVPLGGKLQIFDNARDYATAVTTDLEVLDGFTHLYDAAVYATGTLLEDKDIQRYIDLYQAQPTVILITDGFNNVKSGDVCKDNAPRLEPLLRHLTKVRRGDEIDLRKRPSIYTVGLGSPARPHFELPDRDRESVRPIDLCGARLVDRRIDGDLERRGIDNASLDWIANAGGGFSYVRRDKKGLGEAFRAAASARYYWFEARYRVDPFYLRRSFRAGIRLTSFAEASASVDIHPSAWLDGPPGTVGPDGWSIEQPYRHSATVGLPTLGLLVGLSFLGAAWFNSKRALFGRVRR